MAPAKKAVKKVATVKKPRIKRTPVKQTFVAIVIDKSGSMNTIRANAVSAINEQIDNIKNNLKLTGKTKVSLIEFNELVSIVFDKIDAEDLQHITEDQYNPSGFTAMLDAANVAIENLRTDTKETDDTGYLVVVISDGLENRSRINPSTLASKIRELQATGKWTITYLLANVDLATVTNRLHIPAGNVSSFISTAQGMAAGAAAVNTSYASYSILRSAGVSATMDFYTPSNAIVQPSNDTTQPSNLPPSKKTK